MNTTLKNKPFRLWQRFKPYFAYVGIPLLVFFCLLIIELFNHKTFTEGPASFFEFFTGEPLALCVNFFILLIFFVPALFFRRRVFYCLLASAVFLVAGGANGFILLNRMTPFTTADLSMVKSGIDMAPNYFSVPEMILIAAGSLLLIAALTFLFIKGPKSRLSLRTRVISGVSALVLTGGLLTGSIALAFKTQQLTNVFSNLAFAYEDYGFTYCFLQTWLNKGVHRPSNYSASSVSSVRDEIETAPVSEIGETDVNIVFVQLESFIDPAEIKGLSLSEDAVPNWRALFENYSSGYLNVPVVGAGTANTECEVLTGMSTRFFGPGEYPYKTVLMDQAVESIAYDLKENGYAAHAVHNYRATFYNRNDVYANLGFDDFTSLEYMPKLERAPNNWYKDEILTECIVDAIDSTPDQSDFVFAVTVQGHGKYPTDPSIEDPKITVTECPDDDLLYAYEYYVNQVYETDAFIGQLVEALEERDEKTILVLYGDHLPVLQLEAKDMLSGNLFKTQYVIWNNFGLEKEDQALYAYQLASQTLSKLGISTGLFNRFHQAFVGTASYRQDLQLLQYDVLYGNRYLYSEQSAYQTSDLKMGLEDMVVTGISVTRNGWLISGRNFSPYCEIVSDGKALDTEYVAPYLVLVTDDPKTTTPSDLSVRVVDSHNVVLSDTE